MGGEHKQVADSCGEGGLGSRAEIVGGVFSSISAEEIHAAAVVCLSGIKIVFSHGLSRHGGAAARFTPVAAEFGAIERAPLHHVAEGLRTTVETGLL